MATKKIVVFDGGRRFVKLDFESLTKTKDAVRRKWNLSEEFILRGKVNEYFVDIVDDDDLAEFEDAEELFVHLTEGGARGGQSSTFPGEETSRKDTPGDDGHFVSFVRGQKYSSKEVYPPTGIEICGEVYYSTEPPSAKSKIVLEEQRHLEADFNFKGLVRYSKDSPFFIRLARYAVAGNTKLEAQVDNIHSMVISAIHKSHKTLQEIGNSSILGVFVDGINLLLRGDDRDGGLTRLKEARTQTQHLIMRRAAELNRLFQCDCQTIMSVVRSINEERLRQSRRNALSEDALRYAEMAVKSIAGHVHTRSYASFWEYMEHRLEPMVEPHTVVILERMEEDEEKQSKIVHSKAFTNGVVKYYARWVALQQVCSTLHDDLESVEDELVSSLTDRPSVEEARRELPKMQRELDEKMRKDIDRCNVQDAHEDF